MRLDEVRNLNHDDDFIFAIAVGNDGDSMHCAILYKWEDERIRTLDFYGHGQLRSSQTIGDFGHHDYLYVLYNKDLIIEPIALQVPAICELIKENNNIINFGIRFTETKFDENGKIIYADGDFGLTCATFVLAVLKRASINLIDSTDWVVRDEDIEWQKNVLEYYKSKTGDESEKYSEVLVNQFHKSIGCNRYRPEEVAASTAAETIPANFNYCSTFGSKVFDAVNMGIEFYNNTNLE